MAYEIQINGFIGDSGIFGGDNTTLNDVRAQVNSIPNGETVLNVMINSGGGYVTEGKAIYDYLVSLSQDKGFTINTTVLGICGSIATVIAQAGKSGGGIRSGYENSDYFIHNPSWSPQSPDPIEADELLKIANDLKANEDWLANFYSKLGNLSKEDFMAKMKEAKSLSMDEAKSMGLIDNVIKTNIQAATIYKFAAHITKNQNPMTKIEQFITEKFNAFKNEIAQIVKPEIKNESVTTDAGVVIFYSGSLDVGTQVYTDEAMTAPVADGDFVVGGVTYTVLNGAVSQVVEAQVENKELEIANAKIAELTAQLEAKVTELTTAIANKETELTASFEAKFTAFKSQFFTGDKLNEDIIQMVKGDTPQPKNWRDEVIALKKK